MHVVICKSLRFFHQRQWASRKSFRMQIWAGKIIQYMYMQCIYCCLCPKRISQKPFFFYADEIHCRIWKYYENTSNKFTETEVLVTPSRYVQHVIVVTNCLEPGNEQQNTNFENIESPNFFFASCLSEMENISLIFWMLKRSPCIQVFNKSRCMRRICKFTATSSRACHPMSILHNSRRLIMLPHSTFMLIQISWLAPDRALNIYMCSFALSNRMGFS